MKQTRIDKKLISARADYRGLKCPLPVLKARRVLSKIEVGSQAEFLADDPASPLDMAHFCESEGHILCLSEQIDDYFRYVIEKNQVGEQKI